LPTAAVTGNQVFVPLSSGSARTVQLIQRNPCNDVRHIDLLNASY
jgi:hypothetical protein